MMPAGRPPGLVTFALQAGSRTACLSTNFWLTRYVHQGTTCTLACSQQPVRTWLTCWYWKYAAARLSTAVLCTAQQGQQLVGQVCFGQISVFSFPALVG